MTPEVLITSGGTPSAAQAAALTAAAAAVLAEESAGMADPTPSAYRSPWRLAALREGLREELPPPVRR